ncbi:hypothetical protein ACEE99_01770 [Cytobacillus pseudoceanisediminis]
MFAVAGTFLYSREMNSSKRLTLTAVLLFGLSLFIFYMSFDVYAYLDENGIHINCASTIKAVESYQWEEVKSVTQLNKRGLPAQLEIALEDDKKILLNLHSDWYAKRRAFYEVLPEYEIPLDTMEK